MSEFYEEMADVAQELLEEFSTFDESRPAELVLESRHAVDPDRPHDITTGQEQAVPIVGVAIPVQTKFVDGTSILSTMTQVVVPARDLGFEPTTKNILRYDGRDHKPVRMKRVPASGTPIVYFFFVAD